MSNHSYEILQDLLENMDKIQNQLRPWTREVNIFNILKISNQEIRHSNFLAYLFNPSASHGFNDAFLKEFLIKFYQNNKTILQGNLELSIFDLMLGDFDDVLVYRELHNIDLLLVSEKNQTVICIENKIDAAESAHQLNKYENYIMKAYPKYNKLFVFMSPEGTDPSKDNWGIFTYKEMVEILNNIMNSYKLNPRILMIVEDYIKMVRSNILMDDELKIISQRIYMEYQEALDLIYDFKPDINSTMEEIIIEALTELKDEGKIIFDKKHSVKTYLRFQLEELNQVFPDFPEDIKSGWKNQKSYFLEVENRANGLKVWVSFHSGRSMKIREDVEKKLSVLNQTNRRANWAYWVVGSSHMFPNSKDYLDNLLNNLYENDREKVVAEVKESLESHILRIKKMFEPLTKEYDRLNKS